MREGDVLDEPVRWTIKVSKETDIAVRSFLAQRGYKKGDLFRRGRYVGERTAWACRAAD
jgi:hypothetical protein